MLPRWTRLAVVGAGASIALECSLDERPLERLTVTWHFGDAGEAGQGGPSVGIGAGGEADGAGGERANHWSFDAGADGFTAESGVEQSWSVIGVAGERAYGSLLVANAVVADEDGFWMAGTSKCVAVTEKRYYDVSAQMLIPAGQPPGAVGFAVEFFNAPGCEGLLLDLSSYLTATTGEWIRADRNRSSPPGARSALVRLVVTKLHRNPSFEAHFDQVRFAVE